MSEPYTPTTDEVHSSYYAANASVNDCGEADAEFNRWLAAHDREVLGRAAERADRALDRYFEDYRIEGQRAVLAAIRDEVR